MSVEVAVLGPLRVTLDGDEVAVPGARERTTLALLATEAGRAVSVARLTAFLWGEDPPRTASKTLQTYVSRLRGLIGGELLERQGAAYVLQLPALHVDTAVFERDCREGGRAARDGQSAAAVRAYTAALGRWRGDEPADVGTTAGAEAWRSAWLQARQSAVEGLARARLQVGQPGQVVTLLEREVARHPEREHLWSLLMRAYAEGGQPSAALDAFGRARAYAVEELGVDPSAGLVALHEAVLRGELSVPAPAAVLPAAPAVAGTGRHGDALLDPQPPPPPLGPLIGRERELHAVDDALARHRVVTVTGTGGVGKTRLAAEVVHGREATAWCELAALPPGTDIDRAVLTSLRLVAATTDEPLATASAVLGADDLVLVLDNAEHVLEPARSAVLELLSANSGLTILVTSRQPLRIAGECVVPLWPLGTDGGKAAVAVLEEAIRRAGGDPTGHRDLLDAICRRLDGLPLALELVAPLVRSLGPAAVRDGLDDRFGLLDVAWDVTGRERDLEGTVGWSEALLDPSLRELFRSLSVFAGPFDVADAAALWRSDRDVRRAIAALVDRCLVEPTRTDPPRFRLLETVRAYARRALGGAALTDLRDRHAAWVAGMADDLRARFWSADEADLVSMLDDHLDEFDAAVRWAVSRRHTDTALRIAAGLGYPMFTGIRRDLALWIEQVAHAADGDVHPLLAEVWGHVAGWRRATGDDEQADEAAAIGRDIAAAADVPIPVSLIRQDVLARVRAYDVDGARAVADAAEGTIPQADYLELQGSIIPVEFATGRAEEATTRLGWLIPRLEATGSPTLRAFALIGPRAPAVGADPAEALPGLREARELACAAGSRLAENIALVSLASAAGRTGDDQQAAAVFCDILGRWGVQGAWRSEWNTLREVAEFLARRWHHEPVLVLESAAAAAPDAPDLIGTQLDYLQQAVTHARAALGPDIAAAAERRGAAMGGAEAVRYAQEVLDRLFA